MNIIIFGGTGTLGSAFIKHYKGRYKIVCAARNEYNLVKMKKKHPEIEIEFCDISKKININGSFDFAINCAAMKHVSTCENNPIQAMDTNVNGVLNVIEFCKEKDIKLIHISTDKAVNPINFYGHTKKIAERLVCESGNHVIRFPNIFESSGSVAEILRDKKKGEVFELSDLNVWRYFIKQRSATSIIDSFIIAIDFGELDLKDHSVFIPSDIDAIMIKDLVRAYDEEIIIKEVGLRPGEKIREKLHPFDFTAPKFLSVKEIRDKYINSMEIENDNT